MAIKVGDKIPSVTLHYLTPEGMQSVPSDEFFAGKKVAGGFIPSEDQGYFFLNVQLPDAASLERTDAVCRKIDAILAATPEVQSYNTITGFSLLSFSSATYGAFYFVSLKKWSERPGAEHTDEAVINRLNQQLFGRINEAFAFGFPMLYGLMTVAIAIAAGLIASTMFRKAAH